MCVSSDFCFGLFSSPSQPHHFRKEPPLSRREDKRRVYIIFDFGKRCGTFEISELAFLVNLSGKVCTGFV